MVAACGSGGHAAPPPDGGAADAAAEAARCPTLWIARQARTVVPGATAPFGAALLLDGPEVYWTASPRCGPDGCAAEPILWRAPLAGGDPVATMTSDQFAGDLAASPSWVFLEVGDGLLRLSPDGASTATVAGVAAPWFVAADGSAIYVGQGTEIRRARPDGSSAVVLAPVKDARSAVLYRGAIYWLEDHAIWLVPTGGGPPVRLLDAAGEIPTALTVGPSGVFFATEDDDAGHGSIWRLGEAGEPERLVDHQYTGERLVSGDGFVYWQDGDHRLHRLAADGSCVETRDPGEATPLAPGPGGLLFFDPTGLVLLAD